MIDDLRAITFFVKTIELGSFRECAKHFNLSPSVISQQISALEQKHGVTLLYRTTRKLSLTDEGEAFFLQAQKMVQAAHGAINTLSQNSETPSGKINLTMPAGLINAPLMFKIGEFAQQHPQINLDIQFTDRRVDLIDEGIDIAIRVGKLKDSSLMSRKIGVIKRKLVCSKTYLKDRKLPRHPHELSNWHWIKMKMMPPLRTLLDKSGKVCDIPFSPQIEVDNVDAMAQMSRMGLGLSTPPEYLISDDFKNQTLVEILPEWQPTSMEIYAVWPENGQRRTLTALLLKTLRPT